MIDPQKQSAEGVPAQPELTDIEAPAQELNPEDAENVRGGLIGLLYPVADKQMPSITQSFADGSVFNANKG